MVAGELGRAAVFQDDCVDDVAAETGHAPPPSCWSALCPATWVNYVVRSHTLRSTSSLTGRDGTQAGGQIAACGQGPACRSRGLRPMRVEGSRAIRAAGDFPAPRRKDWVPDMTSMPTCGSQLGRRP